MINQKDKWKLLKSDLKILFKEFKWWHGALLAGVVLAFFIHMLVML